MQRCAALALCTALAAQPGCAHQQLTNQQVAAGAVGVVVVVGFLVLMGMAADCERAGQCPKPPPSQ
jgi:hypothetical protein